MQRLSSGLVIVRQINEGQFVLCELPSGEWVVGTDRHAQPVASIDEIKAFASERTIALVQASLDRRVRPIASAAPKAVEVAFSEDGRVPAAVRQEIDELVQLYLALSQDIRKQIKGMMEAFVGPKIVEEPVRVDLSPVPAPLPSNILRSAAQDLYPGRTITKEEPMSGGVLRTYDSGQREFVPDVSAIDRQIKVEATAAESDAAPAYPCVFCSKEYPGEKSRDLHQERCSERPVSTVAVSA